MESLLSNSVTSKYLRVINVLLLTIGTLALIKAFSLITF